MTSRPPRLLLLLPLFVYACSVDTTRSADAGTDAALYEGDDGSPSTGYMPSDGGPPSALDATVSIDASLDATTVVVPDASECIAMGCEELGYECGQTVDNCGNPLDCNLQDNASPCAPPARCGGDPDLGANKCGCKPRADACTELGAQCGAIDECGMIIECGSCSDGQLCLSNKCACTPISDPCGGKVCGMAPDGCGQMVACGANNGECAVGTCDDASGQCGCRPRTEACAGKTGAITENGCSYNCDVACVPDNAAACAGAECGTATNNCGDIISCGAAAGACGAGLSCAGPQFIADSTLPARTAAYQGGYCIPSNAAKLIGKYAARAHGFRLAGNTLLSFVNRAEAVSLITMQYSLASQRVRMRDVGCVATTVAAPDFALGARSIIQNYKELEPVEIDLTLAGDRWTRGDIPHPVLGYGLPNGYTVGMPAFCVGREGQEVELPASDPRRDTFWSDNRCTCPAAATANSMPESVYSTSVARDCRIVDSDGDGKPGFSAYARASVIASTLYNANISHGTWTGVIQDDGYHVGWVGETVQPMERAVLGCSATGGACSEPSIDCGCSENQQPVQFVPLAANAAVTCDDYYQESSSLLEIVRQAKIDAEFGVSFGSCDGPGQCPEGSICRANQCFPMTSKGACAYGPNDPCADKPGTFCESCPSGMECKSDLACWPTSTGCPVNREVGGLCKPPAP